MQARAKGSQRTVERTRGKRRLPWYLPICCLSGLLPDNGQASLMRHIVLVVQWIHS
jgi:hypothetical protein